MSEQSQPYPGDNATAEELFALAEEYWRAADKLNRIGRRGHAFSRAPFRLTAIHAIELYLNALLLFEGVKHCEVRSLHHNLADRAKHQGATKLRLRSLTSVHLEKMSERREYLVSRYGTD